jgi:uncharacterized protein (DUF433 family)
VNQKLPPVRVLHPHVVLDPRGSPVVEGSRVPVRRLYAWHRERIAIATMLKRYPQIGPARLFDALSFAYDNLDLIHADLERESEAIRTKKAPPVTRRKADESQLDLPLFGDE